MHFRALFKIAKSEKCTFHPIFLEVLYHYFYSAFNASINTYLNVYELLYYITKPLYVKWHISMFTLPPILAIYAKFNIHSCTTCKYYNPCSTLQANNIVAKIGVVLSFFPKI